MRPNCCRARSERASPIRRVGIPGVAAEPNGLRISFAGMTPEEIRAGRKISGRIFQTNLERVRAHAPLVEAAALV